MVLLSNGLNMWAIQFLPSNQSALLNSTPAFWIAGLGVFGKRGHPLTRWAVLGLVIGFLGVVLMLIPKGLPRTQSLLAQAGVLTGCLSWSLGTLYYRSIDTQLSSLMFMALQMLMGGLMPFGVAIVHGDAARWVPDTSGLIALFYLTFFSSCLAYTAYGWLSPQSPPPTLIEPLRLRESRGSRPSSAGNSCTSTYRGHSSPGHGDHHSRREYVDSARRQSHDPGSHRSENSLAGSKHAMRDAAALHDHFDLALAADEP